jgi:hypothetical protein
MKRDDDRPDSELSSDQAREGTRLQGAVERLAMLVQSGIKGGAFTRIAGGDDLDQTSTYILYLR